MDLNYLAKELDKPIRINLPVSYRLKLLEIEREHSLGTKEAIAFLIDLYYLENPYSLEVIKKRILSRIAKGINGRYLLQLKLIYVALGHFLKKVRYI